ncbi:MAG: bifunctional diaminohydroxyphosphoribosylaminopyrimidine deaminase/5-amino-6-(5-phosphoribosylamino)uracil reductase RibD [Saprospiraceae bacterium]|nr:bifunctional diaminohydroxyphosphoribosylaminopyrimidine deaminase/5-amino-6-(5-phosphoribosylamino)uracil reductase RibD [Saprospiraceae bacterium]
MSPTEAELYMQHCFFLAKKGLGKVSPNPLVGAVLVCDHRIIGEGYHRAYGSPHAEVNAIESVAPENRHLIANSTLFVSLEPCNHHGKTPPCTLRIVQEGIRDLYYSTTDPNPKMSGQSLSWLKENGVRIHGPIMQDSGIELIKSFHINQTEQRPYVILKFAQSSDWYMAIGGRTKISNPYTDMLVHKWRHETDGILIGRNTLHIDNPELTTRLWPGKNPVRFLLGNIAVEEKKNYKFFAEHSPAYMLNEICEEPSPQLPQILNELWRKGIGILLVEGGARTIQNFINTGLWDEARVITNQSLKIGGGLSAPSVRGQLEKEIILDSDIIRIIRKNRPS